MTTLRQAQGHPEGNRGTNLFPRDGEPVEGSNRAEGASGVEFTDLST